MDAEDRADRETWEGGMSDDAYYRRRNVIHKALRLRGPSRVSDLTSYLGIGHDELTAKLRSLRTDGHVAYDASQKLWWVR